MYNLYKGVYAIELEPSEFAVGQNHPNPFREKTKIKYCVAFTTRVRLTVFDSEGNEIQILVDEEKDPGTYEVEFKTVETHRDASLHNGFYYYRFEAGDYKSEKKMLLIK